MRKMLLCSIVSAVLLSGCGAASLNAAQSPSRDLSRFTYTRIYCTPDTETHFETVTVELSKVSTNPPASPAYLGATVRPPACSSEDTTRTGVLMT
jgi:outer membrane lipoprotein-sorting protein